MGRAPGAHVTLPLWCWPLLLPLIAAGLVVWTAIGLVVIGRATWETFR
jgi:hypothetical protein